MYAGIDVSGEYNVSDVEELLDNTALQLLLSFIDYMSSGNGKQ